MKAHFRNSIPLAMTIALAAGSAVAQDVILRRYIWDGSDNGLWAVAGNWTTDRSPPPGADLLFPAAGFWRTTVNNYTAGTSFGLITYSDDGYEVFGNALVLTEGIAATHGAGVTTFGPDITLGANASFTAQNAGATLTLGGLMTLASSYYSTFGGAGLVQVTNAVRRVFNVAGGIALIKDGAGTTLLTKSNDLRAGAVWVRGGTLALAHNFALGGAGTTTVSNGAILALAGGVRLDSGPIILAGTLRSDSGANVVSDTITLSDGNAAFAAPGSLTVSGLVAGAVGFTKIGVDSLRLVANNSYTGPTLLAEGTLMVDGIQPASAMLLNGGTLRGRGTVGFITSLSGGGTIGQSFGTTTQSCAGLDLNAATTVRASISGTASGPRSSQLIVNGPVDLGGSALDLDVFPLSTSPVAGDAITILRNDDTDLVVGMFANLPEGAVTNVNGIVFRITYAGGDGNDVALIVLPSQRVWDGGVVGSYWNETDNWDPSNFPPKSGDDLLFPAGAARLNNTNNLGLSTTFHSVTFTGDGYTLNGNQISLQAGVTAALASSTNRVALPIRLQTNQTFAASNGAALLLLTNLDTFGKELTLAGEGEHRVSGVVSGLGSLVKAGAGLALLSASNSYAGSTEVLQGTLHVARNHALGGTATGTVVAAAGTLAVVPGLNVPEPLTLAGALQQNSATNGTSVWSGPIVLQGASPNVEVGNSTLLVSGLISGAGSFTKIGGGTLMLTADNAYSGATVLAGGRLLVNGAQPQSFVQLSGGTLGGTGAVGQVIASGPGLKIVSPGASFGVLTTSNVLFNSFTRFEVELNGTTPGVNQDQLNVTGSLTLGNSQLVPLTGPALAGGMVMRILNNDGTDPIVGAFAGLPESATLTTTNGLLLRITYQGGDGNDVELRVLNPPPVVDSIARLATGFIQIQGHGLPNLLYTLEASTTLQPGSWVAIAADLVDGNGLFDLIDVDSTNHLMRFYRVLSP
jgi:fibronectin-binding autotransporter adhesin